MCTQTVCAMTKIKANSNSVNVQILHICVLRLPKYKKIRIKINCSVLDVDLIACQELMLLKFYHQIISCKWYI